MKIAPSMLACDFSNMGDEIKKISNNGADWVHMDVMDGIFVPNISFGTPIIKSLRNFTNLPFDVHLMIKNPLEYISQFSDAGADIITFHLESDSDTAKTIEKIKSHKKKVGISIKPSTDISAITPYLNDIDLILIMTVEPGFGGQKFMPEQMEKTLYIKENAPNVTIEVDGGVNLETIKTIKNYPVDVVVSGTCIFNSKNMRETIEKLKL
ncbi:MAG: ribulose-phosphate 3-epimerase [Acutalibacteraceae bacterium]